MGKLPAGNSAQHVAVFSFLLSLWQSGVWSALGGSVVGLETCEMP